MKRGVSNYQSSFERIWRNSKRRKASFSTKLLETRQISRFLSMINQSHKIMNLIISQSSWRQKSWPNSFFFQANLTLPKPFSLNFVSFNDVLRKSLMRLFLKKNLIRNFYKKIWVVRFPPKYHILQNKKVNSPTGTWTRVSRVRVWYPNQLDY